MMGIISLVLAPVIATLFGWCLTRFLRINLPFMERLALSYVFGLAGITLLMFYLNVIKIPFSALSALFIPFLVIGFFAFKEKRKLTNLLFKFKNLKRGLVGLKASFLKQWRPFSLFEKAFFLIIVFVFLTAFIRALYWPVFYWDAMTAYDSRALFFFKEGLMTTVSQNLSWQFHPYPPFTSLAHTYFYLLGAVNPKILYTLIYATLLITMYFSLRSKASRLVSLILVFLLAVNPFVLEHAAAAYTNLSYTFFLAMGTIYLIRFFESKNISLFWVGIILIALSAWTRPGPEWFALMALIVLSVFAFFNRKYFWLPIVFILTFLFVWLPWPFFLKFGIGQERLLVGTGGGVVVSDIILNTLRGNVDFGTLFRMIGLLLSTTWRSLGYILYLFLAAFALSFFDIKKMKREIYVLLFIVLYALTIFLGVYKFVFSFPDWQNLVVNSVNRFIMFFLPLMIYYLGSVFYKEWKK